MTVKSLMVLIGVDPSQFEAGMNKMKASLEAHQKTFTAIGAGMTAVGGVMTAFFGKCVKEVIGAEAAEARLHQALSNVAGASKTGADMLIRYAEALQQTTGVSHEEIENAQALLATMGLNERQIAALTPRILDMAVAHRRATGGEIDLTEAAQSLGRAVNGHIELLGRHGVVLSEQTKKTGDFSLLLKDLDKAFGGAAAAAGKTFAGQMSILKVNIDETMKAIGSQLIPILLPLVQKITGAVKVGLAWVESHKALVKILIPVVAGVGVLLTVLGPLVILFPKIVAGVMAVAKSFIFLATNPIALVILAVGGLALAFNQLAAAEKVNILSHEQAARVTKDLDEANKAACLTVDKTGKLYEDLKEKYHNNNVEMALALRGNKEGKVLMDAFNAALTEQTKKFEESKKGLGDQGKAAEDAGKALVAFLKNLGSLGVEQDTVNEKIKKFKEILTDELKKGTLSEVEYEKWAAGEKLRLRKEEIDKEVIDITKNNELKLLAQKNYETAVRAIDTKAKLDKINILLAIYEENKKSLITMLQDIRNFATAKAEIEHLINMTSLTGIKAELAQIEYERTVKLAALEIEYEDNVAQRDRLEKLWNEYYDRQTVSVKTGTEKYKSMWNNLCSEMAQNWVDLFTTMGEKALTFSNYFKTMWEGMRSSLKMILDRMMTDFMTVIFEQIAGEKLLALAGAAAGAFTALGPLGFPLAIASMAAVAALFGSLHLAEGGVVTQTGLATVHRGETYIPTARAEPLAPRAFTVPRVQRTLNIHIDHYVGGRKWDEQIVKVIEEADALGNLRLRKAYR